MSTFSLILSFGCMIGLAWAVLQAAPAERMRLTDAGLWVLAGSLIGGRGVYVVVNWPYFQVHPLEIFQPWLGGLAGVGALAGALLALAPAAALCSSAPFGRQSIAALADALLPLLAVVSVAAWLGCWLTGCAYGEPLNAWWALPARDEMGNFAARWPVQPLGVLLTLGWFAALDTRLAQNWRPRPGVAAALGVLGVALLLCGLSFLRADPAPLWRGLRLETWGWLGLALVAASALLLGKGKGEGEKG